VWLPCFASPPHEALLQLQGKQLEQVLTDNADQYYFVTLTTTVCEGSHKKGAINVVHTHKLYLIDPCQPLSPLVLQLQTTPPQKVVWCQKIGVSWFLKPIKIS
jgi:hypothetical protein